MLRVALFVFTLVLSACGSDSGEPLAPSDAGDSGAGGAAHAGSGGSEATGTGGVMRGSGGAGSNAQPMGTGGTMRGSGGTSPDAGHDVGLDAGRDAGSSTTCPGAKPDATNTGVPAGVQLTIVDHDVTVTDDGTTIDAQDIQGFLIIKASHVRVTRTIVRGGVATQNGAGIAVQSGTDVVIEDSEVALAHPSALLDGVSASNVIVRRSNLHGGVDGIKVGSNSTIECSFIHDLQAFDSDPNQGGGATHNDSIQILSGTHIRVVGNQLLAAKSDNAAIQVTQDFGAVSDLEIESNWADGGGCTFNFSHNGGDGLAVTTRDNRFGRNSFFDCPMLKSTKTTLTSSGDVFDDDDTQVPVQTHD